MGCSQSLSTHAVPAPSEPARTEAPKLREERNSPASPASLTSLKIGNRSEPECEPKIARRDWNSWKHEVDLVDLKLMESGQSLPVNQFVHRAMKSLSDFLDDPSKLSEVIKERRLKLQEMCDSETPTTAATATGSVRSASKNDLDVSRSFPVLKQISANRQPGQQEIVNL